MLRKATGIAKEHSINKISIVMIVGKFKIMRSGPKAVIEVYLGRSLFTSMVGGVA